jgi:nitrate reductase assembly molybdenum cofactor insertion protein NarJ
MKLEHYGALAGLFDFPAPGFIERGRALSESLRERYADAADELALFFDSLPESTLDLQELHTRTFDVQALTTLDIGYVLFGEDYKRGEILAHLAREHAQAQNDCGSELADHLPNLLRLMPKLEDADLTAEMVRELLVPALTLMIREFDPERVEQKNANYRKHHKTLIEPPRAAASTVWGRALKATLCVLTGDFPVGEATAALPSRERLPQSAEFLARIEREMEIGT